MKDRLKCTDSRELLVIILGENGHTVFDEAMNFPSRIPIPEGVRNIETELSSLIGSDILNRYSKVYQSSGFDRDAINVRVTYVRTPEHLELSLIHI